MNRSRPAVSRAGSGRVRIRSARSEEGEDVGTVLSDLRRADAGDLRELIGVAGARLRDGDECGVGEDAELGKTSTFRSPGAPGSQGGEQVLVVPRWAVLVLSLIHISEPTR